MRLEARVDDVDVLRRERVALDVVAIARVVQERRVEALEQAVVDHDLLAAPPFLGRRAQEDDLAGELIGERRQGDRRPDPRGGHRVVATAVTEPGKRVVLGEDPDPRPIAGSPAERGADGGREAAGRVLDGEPVTCQGLRHPGGGVRLLEGRFRVGVDPMRQVDDLVARRLDGARRARALASSNGAAGRVAVNAGTRSPRDCGRGPRNERTITRRATSALGGQRGLRDEDERDHEQRDRQLEQPLQSQDDQDGDDDADPRRTPDRAQPVALVGDLAMPPEDRQPQDRDQASRRRRGP